MSILEIGMDSKIDNNLADFFDVITENVKRERKARNISQLKLANILGHQSPAYVAKIELRNDNAQYNLVHLHTIASEFGISIYKLIPEKYTYKFIPSGSS